MLGVNSETVGGLDAHAIFVHIHVQEDVAVRRDLRRHLQLQVSLLERNRGCTRRSCLLIRDFGALLDQRLDVVCSHDARAGDDLAATIGFERRQLQRQESTGAGVEQAHCHAGSVHAVDTVGREADGRAVIPRGALRHRRHHVGIGVAVACTVGLGSKTQLGTQIAAERVISLDNARLNHHLANRDVDLQQERLDLFQLARNVRHKQLVGARIRGQRTALGENPGCRTTCSSAAASGPATQQHIAHVIRTLIVQAEHLATQRLQLGDLLLRFQLCLLLRCQLTTRRNPQHVAVAARGQALGVQHDLQRLVPRHVFQTQGQGACHAVAGNDVQVGEVSKDLQQRAHVDVLEIERQAFAAVARARDQLVRVVLGRADFHHELRVGLIRAVLPVTTRLNHQAGTGTAIGSTHGLHGRTEVAHVIATAQRLRQRRANKVDHKILALLGDVDRRVGRRQVDHHTAGQIIATAEINVAHGRTLGTCDGYRSGERRCGCGGCHRSRFQRQHILVATNL